MSRSVGGCSNSYQSLQSVYRRSGLKPTLGGISTKWWSQSLDGKCTCGALSTAKARSSRSLSSPTATSGVAAAQETASTAGRCSDGNRHGQTEIQRHRPIADKSEGSLGFYPDNLRRK